MNEKTIDTVFELIGMPLSLRGTQFVKECLLRMGENTTFKALYHDVGKKYNTTPNNVERSVNRAFSKCRDNPIDYQLVNKYLGYARTSNAETLMHLYIKIKMLD